LVTEPPEDAGLRLDCIGISHRTAASELRERAAFSASLLREALSAARREPRIERLVIIATCHRTELYAETPEGSAETGTTLLQWWAATCGVAPAALTPHAYALSGFDAARHLFRVAAGLDSVVLGEAQIVAQVASALRQSVSVHAASPLLKLTFKSAVRSGELARGRVWGRLQAASLGSAAVDAASVASGGLEGRDVIVVGAGEIAELALRALAAHKPRRVTIANRTLETALELGSHHGADACPLDLLRSAMQTADVLIAATRSARVIVDGDMAADVMIRRPSRPLTFVDVSMPRNIDVAVREVAGAQLIGIDDLGTYVSLAHSERRAVVPEVERIVDDELAELRDRVHGHRVRRPAHASRATTTPIPVNA
jgi:glutamyl-tRNA reductase